MSMKLIEELRASAEAHPLDVRLSVMRDAADALAEQAREIERLKADLDECDGGRWKLRTELAALKSQPSGVVLPEYKGGELTDPAGFDEGWDCCINEVSRLNSSPVSAGGVDERAAHAEEAVSILRNMIDSIGAHGNYSKESTLNFLNQALAEVRAALSAPSHGEQVRSREDWGVFASYLLDKCEGDTISEEFLQRTLHSMFHDPHYGALFRGEKAPSAGSQEQGE